MTIIIIIIVVVVAVFSFLSRPSFYVNFISVIYVYLQGVSRLVDITAGGDFLGLCDQKISYKHVSDFGRLRSYGHYLIPAHALTEPAGG